MDEHRTGDLAPTPEKTSEPVEAAPEVERAPIVGGAVRQAGAPNVLFLQRYAGNHAVTKLLTEPSERSGAPARPNPQREGPADGAGTSQAVGTRTIQREPTAPPGNVLTPPSPGPQVDAPPTPHEGGAPSGQSMQAEVDRVVAAQPALDEQVIPDPSAVERGRNDAQEAGAGAAQLGLAANPEMGAFVAQNMGGGAVADAAQVGELQQGAQVRDEPPVKPSLGSRISSWFGAKATGAKNALSGAWSAVSGAASGAWSSIKGAFTKERTHEAGAAGQVGVSVGATVAKDVGVGATTIGVGGDTARSASAAETAGSAATLQHPGNFAQSFASGGFELVHQIGAVVGIFFSALKAAVDIRSLVSSIRIVASLKEAKAQARATGASPALIEAIDYAIRQKYEKIIKRAIGAATALAALGVGLAILIANPVGAALAGIIIGALGLGVVVYKIGRALWKLFKENKGTQRKKIASRLYNQTKAHDTTALAAVRSLHLDPEEIARGPEAVSVDKIMRKLKSS